MKENCLVAEESILISFVVPVYNVKKYLTKCVESIIAIDEKNIEVLLINDGSTDGSAKICDSFTNIDPRVKVIHQQNQGVSVARNVGIENSTGKWICFIDGDDWLEPNYVSELKPYLDSTMDIIFYRFVEDHGTKRVLMPGLCKKGNTEVSDFSYIQRSTLNRHLCKYYVASPWAKLFNREFLLQNDLKFVVGLKKAQDTLFVLEAYGKAQKGLFVNKVLYVYNVHFESVSRRFNSEVVAIHNQLIKELYRVVNNTTIGRTELNKELQVAIFRYLMASIQVNFCHKDNPANFFQRKKDFENAKKLDVYKKAIKTADMSSCRFAERVLSVLIKMNLFWLIDILFHSRAIFFQIKSRLGAR